MQSFVKDRYFTSLRTEQSLGYIVTTMPSEERGINHFVLLVQSNVQDPNYISQKNSEFIQEKHTEIQNFTQAEFDKIRDGYLNDLKKPDTSILSRIRVHFDQVCKMTYNFNIKEDLEKIALGTSLEVIQNLYKEFLIDNKKQIETHVLSHERVENSQNKRKERVTSGDASYISDKEWFLERVTLYPQFNSQNL